MKDGLAEVRVGATCLFDSDPAAEDRECQVKAAALFQALRGDPAKPLSTFAPDATGSGKQVLLIDHDDSFVHMLADYFRQVGASVTVVRYVHAQDMLKQRSWDLLVLSPGPGRPEDFAIKRTIDTALEKQLPIFGVCLGVQAIGEYFGGRLGQLSQPAHGRPSAATTRFTSSATACRASLSSRQPRTTASPWRSSTRRCRLRACSFTRNR
jgi:anthranilate synthase